MNIPFDLINWSGVDSTEMPGKQGTSKVRTCSYSGIKVRLVEYSNGYESDHWCTAGHLAYCINGSFKLSLKGQEDVLVSQGMSFHVSDELTEHKLASETGAKVLIIDGDFLN